MQDRHGICFPSPMNSLVMPSLRAIIPERIAFAPLELDLDIDPGREVELHQRIDGLGVGSTMSRRRLWVLISNCSRDFLFT